MALRTVDDAQYNHTLIFVLSFPCKISMHKCVCVCGGGGGECSLDTKLYPAEGSIL